MDDDKMTIKHSGTVSFYLRSRKGSDITETKYEAPGVLYIKDKKQFLFFQETSMEDDSITKCRIDFDESKIRIRREGQMIMDQSYVLEKAVDGYVKTPYGQLPTKARTHRYKLVQDNSDRIVIGLAYDLFISEDKAGKYDLKVQFNKEAGNQ